MTAPGVPDPSDRPVVVRVTSDRRVEPALVAAVLVLALVGLAVWKPWVGADLATKAPLPSAVGFAAAASTAPGSSAHPAPASTPPGGDAAVAPTLPPPNGLDLSRTGAEDRHAAWGIAVLYAPSATIARAVAGRRPTFAPLAEWQAPAGPGPTMDHPGSATIAVAVTWPHMPAPRAVRLYRTGTISSIGGAVTRLPLAQRVRLAEPLPLLVQLAPYGVDSLDPGPLIDSELTAGTFFLPPHHPPADVGGWLKGGWQPGTYAFVVTRADGTTRTLPFVLRG